MPYFPKQTHPWNHDPATNTAPRIPDRAACRADILSAGVRHFPVIRVPWSSHPPSSRQPASCPRLCHLRSSLLPPPTAVSPAPIRRFLPAGRHGARRRQLLAHANPTDFRLAHAQARDAVAKPSRPIWWNNPCASLAGKPSGSPLRPPPARKIPCAGPISAASFPRLPASW